MASIQLTGLRKTYSNGVEAARDVDLEIADGEFLVLVGPSGCGKSTLLRLIAGLERPSAGTIAIGGVDVTRLAPHERDVAMVFQSYALYPHMSVRRNLEFALKLRRMPKGDIAARVRRVARVLGLEDLLGRRPAALSGGQRQRVAIGRAMVREPKAFLMDEPLSNLDAKLRVAMRAELIRLHERLGVTTVYVTHDQVEAMTLGHRVAVMDGGAILQVDTPYALFQRPNDLFVAAFIGSPAMNLVEATVENGTVRFAGQVLELPSGSPLRDSGRTVVLGARPTDLTLASAGSGKRTLRARVDVVEELGVDAYVHFHLEAPAVQLEPVRAADRQADEVELIADRRARWIARVPSGAPVRPNDHVELRVDVDRLHFFDPETGRALGRSEPARAA